MKLLIILSVIACSYGDKLDRTYLPPESAGTAGGSPGSIAAPGTETELGVPKVTIFGSSTGQTSGPSSFGQPSGPSFGQSTGTSIGKPSGPSFGQPTGSSIGKPSDPTFGQPTGPSFGQPSGPSFGQPTGSSIGKPSSPTFGQSSESSFVQPSGPSFGQPTGSSIGKPSGPTFGQPSKPSFGQPSGPSFGQPTGSAVGQPSVTSFGQPSGPSVDQTSGPSFGQPSGTSFDRQGQNQAGVQSGSTQPGQSGAGLFGSQYNQAGNSAKAGTPGFTQAGPGFNNAPVFNGQSQAPTSYNGPSQPERPRASIDRNSETLHYENNIDGDTFAYSFETSNGIAADEAGIATNGVRAQGGFSYTGDDGQFYSVRYTADENGYIPQGHHLPTPHPIPEEILKSLEENARAAAAGTQEGAYNPNEDSNLDNSASYPTIGSNAYQPVQGSVSKYNGPDVSSVTARPQDGQEFGSKYNTGTSFRPQGSLETGNLQYDTPTSSLNNYNRPGSSDNKLSGSQYGNSSPTTSRPGSQDVNSPTSQYTGSFRPGLSSQGTTIPTYNTPTGTINIGQKDSPRPGSSLFSQVRPTPSNQYGTFDSSSSSPTSPNFPAQGSQTFLTDKIPSFGSSSEFPIKLNQSPISQTGASSGSSNNSKRPFESPHFPSQNGAQSSTSQSGTFLTSGSGSLGQNSGYQYNSPSSFSSGTRPGTQKFPSQVSSSSVPQFGASAESTSGSNSQIRPQDFTSGSISDSEPSRPNNSQPAGSQLNRPVSSISKPVGTSPATQYNTAASSPFGATGLSGSRTPNAQYETSAASSEGLEGSRPVGSQSSTSQYNRPTSSTFGTVNTNSQAFPTGQSGLNQRPQFEFSKATGLTKPTIFGAEGQNSQEDESGYKYSRPQSQFGQQDGNLSGSRFRPSDYDASSNPINKENIISSGPSGDNYNPSGSSGSTPKGISNASGFPKFQMSSNQNYPSGQSPTDSQVSLFPGSGQYSSAGLGSKPTDSTFPRGDKPDDNRPAYQFGQIATSKSPMLDSAPYQYNRPGSQEPGQIGYQPTFGSSGGKRPEQTGSQLTFGSLEQERPGQVGSQPTFGSLGQQRPGQIGSQPPFGASGQERPGQVGSRPTFGSLGPQKPGQFSSQPTYGSSGQDRPGQFGSQPTFGSSEQEKPGQVGYQPTFGSSGQKLPGQVGSQNNNGVSKQKRPGQLEPGYDSLNQENHGQTNSQSGYDYSKPNRPGQIGSQSNFSPSSQNVPNQTGTQPSSGFAGQDRPSQSANQQNFGSTGQQRPDQKGFPSGSSTVGSKGPGQIGYQSTQFTSSRQDRPGQFGNGKPTENFNGPRQPPSFSPEEGYKY